MNRWLPLRDAALATALLLGAVYGGSSRLAHLDVALLGYLAATVAACFVTVYRVSAFWRRPPSAFYARALLEAVRRPRELRRLLGAAGRDLAAQRFIARRSRVRWLAHLPPKRSPCPGVGRRGRKKRQRQRRNHRNGFGL